MPFITFPCPKCGKTLETEEAQDTGKSIQCPSCRESVPLPITATTSHLKPARDEPLRVRLVGDNDSRRRKERPAKTMNPLLVALIASVVFVAVGGLATFAFRFLDELQTVHEKPPKQVRLNNQNPPPRVKEPPREKEVLPVDLKIGPPMKPAKMLPAPGSGQTPMLSYRASFGRDGKGKRAIAFSPDGRWIASVGTGAMLSLWDAQSGRLKYKARLHERDDAILPMEFVAISPNGRQIAAHASGKVIIFDAQTLSRLKTIKTLAANAVFSPDGKSLAIFVRPGTIQIWDVENEALVDSLAGVADSTALAFSPDGKYIATGGPNNTVVLLTARPLAVRSRFEGHGEKVNTVAFSPDAKTLASVGSWDGVIKLWDMESLNEKRTIKTQDNRLRKIAYSPSGNVLAAAGAALALYDPQNGIRVDNLAGTRFDIVSITFSPDGKAIAIVDQFDPDIVLYDMTLSRQTQTYSVSKRVVGIAASPDGKTIALAIDGRIELRDVATWKITQTITGHRPFLSRMVYSRNGSLLAFHGANGMVRVWNVKKKKEVQFINQLPNASFYAFGCDGKFLALSDRSKIQIVPLGSNKKPINLQDSANILSLALSRDGRILITGNTDSLVGVWDLNAGRKRRTIQAQDGGVRRIVLSPDESRFLTIGDHQDTSVRVWETATGKRLATLPGHWKGIFGTGFDSRGQRVLIAGNDGVIRVWDLANEKLLVQLRDHDELRRSFALSENGTTVVKLGRKLQIWETDAMASPAETRTDLFRDPPPKPISNRIGFLPVSRTQFVGEIFADKMSLMNQGKWIGLFDFKPQINVIEAATGKSIASIRPPIKKINCIAFAPNGKRYAIGCDDKSIRLFSVSEKAKQSKLLRHSEALRNIAFSPDGKLLVSSTTGRGELIFWDLPNGKPQTIATGELYDRFTFTKNGEYLAVATFSRKLELWQVRDRKRLWSITLPLYADSMSFSAEVKLLAVGGGELIDDDCRVTIWNVRTGQLVKTLNGHTSSIKFVRFLPTGHLLSAQRTHAGVLLADGFSAKLWDFKSGKVIRDFECMFPFIVTQDGKWIVSLRSRKGDFRTRYLHYSRIDALIDDAVQQALTSLARAGADIHREGDQYHIDLDVQGVDTASALAALPKLDKPHTLHVGGSRSFINDNLAAFAGDNHLVSLNMDGLQYLDSEGFRHLSSLKGLESLSLVGTGLRNDDLAYIATLPRLKMLNVARTKITGAGLSRLRSMKSLHTLSLHEIAVEPKDATHLAEINSLREVYFGSDVPQATLERLRKARPRLRLEIAPKQNTKK